MGTMLQRAGLPAGECPELLNITAPEMVGQVHRLYALAGADCCVTNTFGGSAPKLAEYRMGDRVEELNRAGVRVAKRDGAAHVLADVGPTGLVLEPLGSATFEEVFSAFAEQVRALAAEGPDAILIETMTDIAEARCAVLAAKSVCDLPVFVTCTFGLSGRMDLSGTDPETAAVVLEDGRVLLRLDPRVHRRDRGRRRRQGLRGRRRSRPAGHRARGASPRGDAGSRVAYPRDRRAHQPNR